MTTSHTPTPWRNSKKYVEDIYAGDVLIARVIRGPFKNQAEREKADADAARIVRCVNAHDDLVAELQNIANANPKNWDAPFNDTVTFQQWAQSRARFALEKAAK